MHLPNEITGLCTKESNRAQRESASSADSRSPPPSFSFDIAQMYAKWHSILFVSQHTTGVRTIFKTLRYSRNIIANC